MELGWASTERILPATTSRRSSPLWKMSSTSAVERVKRWMRDSRSRPDKSTKSPIQFIEIYIAVFPLLYSCLNWLRAFKLPLFKSRISLMPYFIMARRVRPRPKAKPVYSPGSMPPIFSTLG